MSNPGCPWDLNNLGECFRGIWNPFKWFKLDLGDPNRFATLGELVADIYQTINYYNRDRIHSAHKMSPVQFAATKRL